MTHESQTRKLQPATAFKRAPMDSITGCLVALLAQVLRRVFYCQFYEILVAARLGTGEKVVYVTCQFRMKLTEMNV